jgi:hypothetical protein
VAGRAARHRFDDLELVFVELRLLCSVMICFSPSSPSLARPSLPAGQRVSARFVLANNSN